MANWRQWREQADLGEVRRVTWVCGTERVLVEEVVDHVRSTLAPADVDYVSLVAGSDPDKEVWAQANQYPMTPKAPRLVLVRDADRIKKWKPLEDWINSSRLTPTQHLLFVSNESDFPYLPNPQGKPTTLKPHAELIKAKTLGRLIRCAPPNEEDLVYLVQRLMPGTDSHTAAYLITRTQGSVSLIHNVAGKASVFKGSVSPQVIDALCSESPSEDFTHELLALHKPQAFLALEALAYQDYPKTIGSLDRSLDYMGKLNQALRRKQTLKDISMSKEVPVFIARLLLPYAKHYDPQRITSCRQVLAMADSNIQAGAREATMEAVVSLW